jgi:hypothetical protein
MQEHVATRQIADALKKELEDLFPGYIIKLCYSEEVNILKSEPKQMKGFLGKMKTVTNERCVAHIDDLSEEGRYWITVYDKAVYEVLKEFGQIHGFKNLNRAWPGAGEENARLIEQQGFTRKKKSKKIEERLSPRYERMVER